MTNPADIIDEYRSIAVDWAAGTGTCADILARLIKECTDGSLPVGWQESWQARFRQGWAAVMEYQETIGDIPTHQRYVLDSLSPPYKKVVIGSSFQPGDYLIVQGNWIYRDIHNVEYRMVDVTAPTNFFLVGRDGVIYHHSQEGLRPVMGGDYTITDHYHLVVNQSEENMDA